MNWSRWLLIGVMACGGSDDEKPTPRYEPCPKSVELDDAGGTLEACGAVLVVPAGELLAPTTITLDKVVPSGSAGYGFAFASDAFVLAPASLGIAAELTLPHDSTRTRRFLGQLFDESQWGLIEACEITDSTLSGPIFGFGTFAVLEDQIDWPDSPRGLGGGSLEATFESLTLDIDLDDAGADNHAIYEATAGDPVAVTLDAWLDDQSGTGSDHLRIDVALPAGDTPSVVQVSLADWDGLSYTIWTYLPIDTPAATLELTTSDGPHLAGTIAATLHHFDGATDQTGAFEASFDVTVGMWRYPIEGSCFPEG